MILLRQPLQTLLAYALLATATLFLTGCVTVPQGTSLNDPTPAARTSGQAVWIKPVIISDKKSRSPNIEDTQNGLTLAISSYISSSNRFSATNTLPGKPGEQDQILEFSFETYWLKRHAHPAYFPVAILTATLYIWFDGPIYTDKTDIAGTLKVYDTNNNLLATFTSQHKSEENIGFWSPNYMFPDGATPRTLVMSDMLDQYQAFLKR